MAGEIKSFDSPDETRPFEGKGKADVVNIGGQVVGKDGATMEIGAGDVFAIPPGHDAEVTGDGACVSLDFGKFGEYAKRD